MANARILILENQIFFQISGFISAPTHSPRCSPENTRKKQFRFCIIFFLLFARFKEIFVVCIRISQAMHQVHNNPPHECVSFSLRFVYLFEPLPRVSNSPWRATAFSFFICLDRPHISTWNVQNLWRIYIHSWSYEWEREHSAYKNVWLYARKNKYYILKNDSETWWLIWARRSLLFFFSIFSMFAVLFSLCVALFCRL